MKKNLILTSLVLSCGTLIWCLWQGSSMANRNSAGPAPASHATATHAPDGQRSPALTWEWPKGASMTYDFTSGTSLNLGGSGGTEVDASGCWHVVVLDDGLVDGTVDLATIFSEVRYRSGKNQADFYSQLLEQVPCFIRLSRDGRILGTDFPDYLKAEDQQIIAGLNTVQLQLGAPNAAGSWQGIEQDANGTASVSYQTSGYGLIRKQRRAYTHLSAQGIGKNSCLKITASEFNATRGPVWFKSFEGQESMEFIYEGQPSWSCRQQLQIKARADMTVPEMLTNLAKFATAADARAHLCGNLPEIVQLAGAGSITDLETATARKALYASVDFTAMMQNFEQTMAAAKSQADRQPAIETMRDWLLARPEEAGKLADYLAHKSVAEETSACILNALELSSASPASQAVLATVLGDLNCQSYTKAMLVQAAVAAGGVGEILDQSLMDKLYQLAFALDIPDIAHASDSALFALGTLSRTHPAIRDRLATELGDTLKSATPGSDGYITSALMALANGSIRSESLTATATNLFTASPSEIIRAEALAYLSSTGDATRTASALSDKSSVVQARAVELLTAPSEMTADSVAAVTAMLRNPTADAAARASAAQLLKRHEAEHADITSAYSQTLAQSPPESLRDVLISLTTPTPPR